jgi:hypothetical protein
MRDITKSLSARRWLWLIAIWAASVATLGVVVLLLRVIVRRI